MLYFNTNVGATLATLRWVSGSDVRQQIQFINKLFEVVA